MLMGFRQRAKFLKEFWNSPERTTHGFTKKGIDAFFERDCREHEETMNRLQQEKWALTGKINLVEKEINRVRKETATLEEEVHTLEEEVQCLRREKESLT